MRSALKKKTYNLDSEKIEKVRRLFQAKTDTAAIHKASFLRKFICRFVCCNDLAVSRDLSSGHVS